MNQRKRGFLLGVVLILSVVLFVMAVGYLGSLPRLYQSTFQAGYLAQARAIARAGLEDARVKLEKDPNFPPPGAETQRVFTYIEDFTDLDGSVLGSYEVSIDSTFRQLPYQVIQVTSRGQTGPRTNPQAQTTLTASLNLAPLPAANLYRNLRWDDSGSY